MPNCGIGARALACCCLALAGLAREARGDRIATRDGQQLQGRLIVTNETIRLRTPYGELAIPTKEIRKHERETYEVTLRDGTRLEGRIDGETEKELLLAGSNETRRVALAEVTAVKVAVKKSIPPPPTMPDKERVAAHQRASEAFKTQDHAQALREYARILTFHPDDIIALYNSACAHALLGDKPTALDFLKRAVEAGFVNFDHIQRDGDLETLRAEQIYLALFARRDDHVRAATDKAIARIAEELGKKKVNAKAYTTVLDPERNFVYLHARSADEFEAVRREMAAYADYQWANLFQNKPGMPLYIVLLRSEDSVKVLGRVIGGFYNSGANALFCGDQPGLRLLRTSVVRHEFTHALHMADQQVRLQQHPIWLVEGLATLFESADWKADTLVPRHSFRLPIVQELVRRNRSPGWSGFMKLTHQQFMLGAPINYAQARYMLHYMCEKGALKRFYDEYTNAGNYGADRTAQESLETALGRPLPEIERDWKAWVLTRTVPPLPYLGIATELRGGKLVVSAVVTNSPAAAAGMLQGDTLVAVDGKQVATVAAFTEAIAECEVGDEVTVTVKRGAEQQELKATLAQRPQPAATAEDQEAYLGLTFELRNGAVTITAVAGGSPAAKAGLRVDSTIQGVDGAPVETVRDFLRQLKERKPGDKIRLMVKRGRGRAREVVVTLTEIPPPERVPSRP